jgi:hypothetical protein
MTLSRYDEHELSSVLPAAQARNGAAHAASVMITPAAAAPSAGRARWSGLDSDQIRTKSASNIAMFALGIILD